MCILKALKRDILNTVTNIQNLLGAHEYLAHFKNGWSDHSKVVPFQRKHSTWKKTTKEYKAYIYDVYDKKSELLIILTLFLLLFSNCGTKTTSSEKVVECRLFWISDSYPKNVKDMKGTDIRLVTFHYLIINNTEDRYFLPIKRKIVTKGNEEYCSEIYAYIANKHIPSWFSADTRWSGILEPNDSIQAELKISQWMLDSAKVSTDIELVQLSKAISIRYYKCPSDTAFSSFPIPQLSFTYYDTVAIHYREESNLLDECIYCP